MTAVFTTLVAIVMVVPGISQLQEMKKHSPEGKWIITSLQIEGQLKDVSAKAYEIEFGSDGQMNAKICNRMGGKFTQDGNSISFGPMRSTKMMCPDMHYESAFSLAIMEAEILDFDENSLVLKKGKETLMVLSMQDKE